MKEGKRMQQVKKYIKKKYISVKGENKVGRIKEEEGKIKGGWEGMREKEREGEG